jgi:hypothetical protein
MYVKLRVVHFCGSLIEVVFLAGTMIAVLIELIDEVSTFNDEVVVGESQSCGFEVTVLITIRSS